jgi:hypothetical protein
MLIYEPNFAYSHQTNLGYVRYIAATDSIYMLETFDNSWGPTVTSITYAGH